MVKSLTGSFFILLSLLAMISTAAEVGSDGCVVCPQVEPTCPDCPSGLQCKKIPQTCSQCAYAICAPREHADSFATTEKGDTKGDDCVVCTKEIPKCECAPGQDCVILPQSCHACSKAVCVVPVMSRVGPGAPVVAYVIDSSKRRKKNGGRHTVDIPLEECLKRQNREFELKIMPEFHESSYALNLGPESEFHYDKTREESKRVDNRQRQFKINLHRPQ
ncbi:hypothetical protein R3P38DRAFT_2770149 [Favolaschia claudopus]|uniref:Membrane anchor Opy2 N-terminal domain-containing protein n=1 Tax=Favolaschia claudopus TaxID=2862362 RepID=A0AAW0CKD9_9AGAR